MAQSPLTCGEALCQRDEAETAPGFSVLTTREDGQSCASSDLCLAFVLCASINMTSQLLPRVALSQCHRDQS